MSTASTWTWPDSKVTRIVDGDTFVAEVTRDLGFHGTTTFVQKLRLNRINAKPARTAEGKEATNAAAFLMMTGGTGQGPVKLLIETVGSYKYGDEWMAEVTLPNGRNVSDELVDLGHAVYWDGKGPRPD